MIFVDRSIPKSVAEALKAVRSDVSWLEDHFAHDTPDADWLAEAGRQRWLVVTRDKRIRTRPGERQSLLEHNVGCFCLTQKRDPTRWGYLKLLCLTLDPRPHLSEDRDPTLRISVLHLGGGTEQLTEARSAVGVVAEHHLEEVVHVLVCEAHLRVAALEHRRLRHRVSSFLDVVVDGSDGCEL